MVGVAVICPCVGVRLLYDWALHEPGPPLRVLYINQNVLKSRLTMTPLYSMHGILGL